MPRRNRRGPVFLVNTERLAELLAQDQRRSRRLAERSGSARPRGYSALIRPSDDINLHENREA